MQRQAGSAYMPVSLSDLLTLASRGPASRLDDAAMTLICRLLFDYLRNGMALADPEARPKGSSNTGEPGSRRVA